MDAQRVFTRYSVRLADARGEIVGFAARDGAWLMQLYVKPGWTGHGIGSELLDATLADAAFVTPMLRLYTFARNAGARRFYERHGFVAVASATAPATRKTSPTSATSGRCELERGEPTHPSAGIVE